MVGSLTSFAGTGCTIAGLRNVLTWGSIRWYNGGSMLRLPRPLFLIALVASCLSAVPGVRGEVTVATSESALAPRYVVPTAEYYLAAATGDLNVLQRCLDEGAGVDCPVPQPTPDSLVAAFPPRSRGGLLLRDSGATALMLATAAGQKEAMRFLIDARANCEARTRSDIRPLDIAAERGDTAMMQMLIGVTPQSDAARLFIDVDLATQTATITRDGQPVLTTHVSSGRPDKPTPPGRYVVTHKYTEWRSTLYHNASMPFFLRLSCSSVGLHAGVLPGYPASHGCVRLPSETAKKLFTLIPRGTMVVIR